MMNVKIDFSQLSLQDALDLAILIEQEAQERYQEFSQNVGDRYEGDAADFFRMMAQNEAKHGRELLERRQKLFQNAPMRVSRGMIWDVEAPDYGKPRQYMSVRQAFDIALESEAKAYAFFVEALKHISDLEVCALFEELRDEEAQHKNMLKEQMRKLPPGPKGADLGPDDVDEPPSL